MTFFTTSSSFVHFFVVLFVFITVIDQSPRSHKSGIGCTAQRQNQGFLVNFGSDVAEVFSRFPISNVARVVNPVLKRTQNNIVANKPVSTSRGSGRVLLSNDRKRTRFFVYKNRRNPESYFELDLDHPSHIPTFRVGGDSQVKILIHGFSANGMDRFSTRTKNAYLRATNYPVIIVDWSELSSPAARKKVQNILYFAAADNVERVGKRVCELILFLMHNRIITNLQQVHIVGFSLGAHVAGHAGKLIQQYFGTKITRITGLDPAAPLFRSVAENRKLTRNDAEFVDVIHTSFAGIFSSLGHADFYPNGGQVQPHCLGRKENQDNFLSCSHLSAPDFFAKSVLSRDLVACGCNSYQEFRQYCGNLCFSRSFFGEYASSRTRGRFFIDINL